MFVTALGAVVGSICKRMFSQRRDAQRGCFGPNRILGLSGGISHGLPHACAFQL